MSACCCLSSSPPVFLLDHVWSREISGLEDEILDRWWDRIMTCVWRAVLRLSEHISHSTIETVGSLTDIYIKKNP